jgi:Domain of unknown function (DUF4110)
VISTPLPGETLAMFYARSRTPKIRIVAAISYMKHCPGEYWTQKAHEKSDNRGKLLRRDGFAIAEERYSESSIHHISL